MAHDHDDDHLRQAMLELLLDRVAADRYPSVTMLNLIEAMIRPDELADYVEILLDHIRESTYPSIDMLRRVEGLVAR
jgi:hypothetical protein